MLGHEIKPAIDVLKVVKGNTDCRARELQAYELLDEFVSGQWFCAVGIVLVFSSIPRLRPPSGLSALAFKNGNGTWALPGPMINGSSTPSSGVRMANPVRCSK